MLTTYAHAADAALPSQGSSGAYLETVGSGSVGAAAVERQPVAAPRRGGAALESPAAHTGAMCCTWTGRRQPAAATLAANTLLAGQAGRNEEQHCSGLLYQDHWYTRCTSSG